MPFQYASVDLEYKNRKELRKEDVHYMQEWLRKQPHLPPLIELEIIFFLVSCNYSFEMAKTTIDNYFTLKGMMPEIFGRRDTNTLAATLDRTFLLPLPKLTSEGYQVMYCKLRDCDLSKFVFGDTVKCCEVVLSLALNQKGSVNGLVYVFDLEGFSLAHIAQMPLLSVKKLVTFLQEGLPLQLKQFHYINAGSRLDAFMMLIRPFTKQELFKMTHIHTDYLKTLYNFIPRECMPKEVGGLDESADVLLERVKAMVVDNADFIQEQEERVIDESLRPQKSTKFNHLFGVEGTFKKLELD
uniref:CRAL-TRIO domain-containing protein n=2 Tax=Photinus pyralis TaxID=7054 RepID=A0A1Y1MV86_PHOPY